MVHYYFVIFVFLVEAAIIASSNAATTGSYANGDIVEKLVDRSTTSLRSTTTHRHLPEKNHPSTSNDYKILLESFADPKHEWVEMNDPVMGGKSTGSFRIDAKDGIGIFAGQVNNVPFLHAPGFIQVRSTIMSSIQYPDISHCHAFELIVSSQFPQYQGYRMSFGTQHAPHGKMFAYGYKTHFTLENDSTKDTSFQSIMLPFHKFTDYWDDATGDAIIECHPDDPQDHIYCPTSEALSNIQSIGIWGEGYVGDVNINIQAIYAIHCNDDDDDIDVNKNELDNDVVSETTVSNTESWWSRVEQLLFGDSKTDTTITASTSVSSTQLESQQPSASLSLTKTTTTTTTTALLQRNMLLSSLCQHRW
jgi:hypothetical protein